MMGWNLNMTKPCQTFILGCKQILIFKNLKLCPNLTFSQEKYTELFDQIEWYDMVWHFYEKFFLTLARTSLKSTLLQSLAINWTAFPGDFFFCVCIFFKIIAFSGIRQKKSCQGQMFWTRFHWRCQGGGPTSAPRGFINIFCSSWEKTACRVQGIRRYQHLHCHKDDRTMMPSVYTQKPVHYNVQMHLCLHFLRNMPFAKENPFCLGSAAFKMRCLAIFAKSLGPTCSRIFFVGTWAKCWSSQKHQNLTKPSTGMRCNLKSLAILLMEEIRLTSWYGESTIFYSVLSIPSGAGFLPSTVVLMRFDAIRRHPLFSCVFVVELFSAVSRRRKWMQFQTTSKQQPFSLIASNRSICHSHCFPRIHNGHEFVKHHFYWKRKRDGDNHGAFHDII